jgi:hypothetical protein
MKSPKKNKRKDMRKRFVEKSKYERTTQPTRQVSFSENYYKDDNGKYKNNKDKKYSFIETDEKSILPDSNMNAGVGTSKNSYQQKYREAYKDSGKRGFKKSKTDKPNLKVSKNNLVNQRGDKNRRGPWVEPGLFKLEEQVGSEAENMLENAKDNDTMYFSRRRDANRYKRKYDNDIRKEEKEKFKRFDKFRKSNNWSRLKPSEAEGFLKWKDNLPSNLRYTGKDYDMTQAYKAKADPKWVDHDKEFRQEEADLKSWGIESKRPDFIKERDGKLGAFHLSTRNPKTGEYMKSPKHKSTLKAAQEDRDAGGEIYIGRKTPLGRRKVYSGTTEDNPDIDGYVAKKGDKAMRFLEKQNEKTMKKESKYESKPIVPRKFRAGTGFYRNTESFTAPQVYKNKQRTIGDDLNKIAPVVRGGFALANIGSSLLGKKEGPMLDTKKYSKPVAEPDPVAYETEDLMPKTNIDLLDNNAVLQDKYKNRYKDFGMKKGGYKKGSKYVSGLKKRYC